jgi:hypothetical protein
MRARLVIDVVGHMKKIRAMDVSNGCKTKEVLLCMRDVGYKFLAPRYSIIYIGRTSRLHARLVAWYC